MQTEPQGWKGTGAIAWMANNPIAANLMTVFLLVAGLISVLRMKQEVFPEFTLDMVNVSVAYPGASPAEVEQGIVLALEEAIRGVDGVKKVTSRAQEGVGVVTAEILLGAKPDKVLADIKNEVDRVRTLPLDAEDPQVSLATRKQRVVTLVLSGDTDRHTLHDLAEHARDELLIRKAATQVSVGGLPPLEIAVEVPRDALAAYGLTLNDVAAQIGAASLEVPGGAIDARGGELLVRVADRSRTGADFADIILRGARNGAEVRLGDVARITDGFADDDQSTWFGGKPAALVDIFRVGEETPTQIAEGVKAYAAELEAELPDGVHATIWDDDSELLRARIDLITHDLWTGLVLLFIALALFLDLRLAFWVAWGIPTAVAAAFILMPYFGISINMVSLFALLITLGILVDDAIVVAESFYEKWSKGVPPMQAAVEGAQELAVPVTFGVTSVLAAFTPLLFVPGTTGKIFGIIPIVVMTTIVLSLAECFFLLVAHLSHLSSSRRGPVGLLVRATDPVRNFLSDGLARLTQGPYDTLVRFVIEWRYLAVAASMGLFFITVAYVAAGLIPFSFMPRIESDLVRATARLPYGVAIEQTEQVRAVLEASLTQALEETDATNEVRGVLTLVGQGITMGGPGGGGPRPSGSHLLTIEVDLLPGDVRKVSSKAVEIAWQRLTPPIAGLESLTFTADMAPGGGAALDVQLSHADTEILATASRDLTEQVRGYAGLKNVDNTFASGKPQLDFHLEPNARTLGLTAFELARQVRASFFGAEAIREQRGREEIKVMVRLPKEQRISEYDLDQLDVRTPTGGWVPLGAVSSYERGRAASTIARENGRRVVDVTAELGPGAKSAQPFLDSLETEVLPALTAKYPGLTARFAGQRENQNEALANLGANFRYTLIAIFAMLAIPFRSYIQPIIVMFAIPMGFVGAIGGHLLHGFELSIISMMGIIAASGVVVNDSIVMIDAVNGFRDDEGLSPLEAVVAAGKRRMRPILLNSFTNYAGLASIIFEKSTQARFLIPMAISLAYGVVFTTFIALVVVPALYMIVEDVRSGFWRLWGWLYPANPEPEVMREGK